MDRDWTEPPTQILDRLHFNCIACPLSPLGPPPVYSHSPFCSSQQASLIRKAERTAMDMNECVLSSAVLERTRHGHVLTHTHTLHPPHTHTHTHPLSNEDDRLFFSKLFKVSLNADTITTSTRVRIIIIT
jgi:hypothetical protein